MGGAGVDVAEGERWRLTEHGIFEAEIREVLEALEGKNEYELQGDEVDRCGGVMNHFLNFHEILETVAVNQHDIPRHAPQ